ncbi:MAG: hypothetical protein ABR599_05865 [Gemmatimonadota bacterium]
MDSDPRRLAAERRHAASSMTLSMNTLALLCLVAVILFGSAVVVMLWMNGRRERRKTPVRPPRRRVEPDRHPVPSRDPQPTSEDHELVEAFFRSLEPPSG